MAGKATVLVTAAGSFCAVNIIKSLRLAAGYRIIAADIHPMSAGAFCADKGYLVPKEAPDGRFIDAVLDICEKEDVDAVIPGFDSELPYFAAARKRFEEAGVKLILGDDGLIALSNDKLGTAAFLRERGFPAPATFPGDRIDGAERAFGYPMIIKPNCGWGSRLVAAASSREQAVDSAEKIRENGWLPIFQEMIPETEGEFTVGVAMGAGSELLGVLAAKREIIKGDSRRIWIEEYPGICEQAVRMAKAIGSSGPMNFQGRLVQGALKVFEINARFSTTTFVRALCGFNEVDCVIRNQLHGERPAMRPRYGKVAVAFLDYALLDDRDLKGFSESGEMSKKGVVRSLL